MDKEIFTAMVILDLQKAFDTYKINEHEQNIILVGLSPISPKYLTWHLFYSSSEYLWRS